MKHKINLNAVNQYPKGAIIYSEGDSLSSIALVIKGHVQIHHEGARYMMGPGSFLAVSDVSHGEHQSTYTALEALTIYVFAIEHKDDLDNVLSINKDYNGFIIMSLNKVISELGRLYKDIIKHSHSLYRFLTDRFKFYFESASRLGYAARRAEWVDELTELDSVLLDLDKINYYTEGAAIPVDVLKSYYAYSSIITIYQLEDQVDLIDQLNEALREYASKLRFMAECLINETDSCLFGLIAEYAIEVTNSGGNSGELIDNMDSIIEEINKTEAFFKSSLGRKMNIHRKRMEEAYHLLLTGTKDKDMSVQTYLKYSMEDAEKVITKLRESYSQIIEYSSIDKNKAKKLQDIMQDFVNLKDRLSMDDNARKIRKQLTEEHYELYKHVFLKAYKDENTPRIIDMFLNYGYADERLLSNEQIVSLYFLKDEDVSDKINVYNIKQWLELIYEGKKEPSKNEFDQEYSEMLISQRNRGRLTEEQVKEYCSDMEKKLEYEIQNMLRYNNRTTNGQISTFTPILHKDMMYGQFDKSFVTPSVITEEFDKMLEIDYSVFDRETLYVNKEKKIEKEYIIERVYPDIILMPTVGINGVMWQDITGKRRNSPGRILFPIFCEANLFQNIVKVCGRFRWELCRTIEGMAWNDIKVKSLTSEYSDYIQFYRKNRELSEEKKERIKNQIQKGRNNSREIFVIDYEFWVNYEARGAIKLNKPVREIMATYCPYSKKLREKLTIQPIFEEAYAKFNRNRLKKIRETEGRHRLLQKDNIEVTKELVDTLIYYKET